MKIDGKFNDNILLKRKMENKRAIFPFYFFNIEVGGNFSII
jgi:hypothetical protein